MTNNKEFFVAVVRDIIKATGGDMNNPILKMILDQMLQKTTEGEAKAIIDLVRDKIRDFDYQQVYVSESKKSVFG